MKNLRRLIREELLKEQVSGGLSNTSPCPDGMMNNISGNNMSYLCSPGNEQNWYDAFTPYYGTAEGWEDSWTGQYQNYCCSPNTATTTTFSGETTGCGGFANIPQDFQDTICDSCEDPNYINMHCECCPGGSGVASINPEDIGTTIEPQGMPSMAKKRPVKMKNKKLRQKIKENLNLLTENIVCNTKTITCPCEYSLPSQQGTCQGSRTIYCSGAYTDDCNCCGGEGHTTDTGGGYLEPIYKKRRY